MSEVLKTKISAMGGAYDAGDRFDRSLELWQVNDKSADQDILPSKTTSDARTNDVARNDSYIAGGIKTYKDTVVGSRYRLNAKPAYKVLGLDEMWANEFSEEVEAKFSLWAESLNNWPDAAGRMTLTQLVRQAIGVFVTRGEYLATAEWLSRDMSRPAYTAVQPIDLYRLSNPYNSQGFYYPTNEKNVRGGIKMDSKGKPLGYYIRHRDEYYYGRANISDSYRWSYIRATVSRFGPLSRRPQVLHFIDQNRPAQTRGMSDLVAALKSIRMCQKFRDVTLQNAALNASFAATIESELPRDTVYQQIGAGNVPESVLDYAGQFMQGVTEYSNEADNLQIDGIKVPHLFPGTSLKLMPAGTVGGVGTDFEQSFLRLISSALGISYEELSRDYKQVSYSGAKAVLNQTSKAMRSAKRFIADKLASNIYRLWLEEMYNKGEITTMVGRPSFYEGMNLDAYVNAEWIGGFASQIDEKKETEAAILRINSGLSTYETEVARFGQDYRQVFQQRAKEKERMAELDILPVEMNAQEMEEQDEESDDE